VRTPQNNNWRTWIYLPCLAECAKTSYLSPTLTARQTASATKDADMASCLSCRGPYVVPVCDRGTLMVPQLASMPTQCVSYVTCSGELPSRNTANEEEGTVWSSVARGV
jgi:hypothetical protein